MTRSWAPRRWRTDAAPPVRAAAVAVGSASARAVRPGVAIINSVQDYWSQQLATSGTTYTKADAVFFSGQTPTGCGTGETGMGPFYCPTDKHVYIDLSFWQELKTQFGANDSLFTQAYVLAHEYGHRVQDLLGTNDRVSSANDVSNALDTAGKIGDDYIQTHLGSGSVDASQFTHGSSAQRKKWFTAGYTSGKPTSCNTFDTNNLG